VCARCRYGPHGSSRSGYEFSEKGELTCSVKLAPFAFASREAAETRDGQEKQMALVLRHALYSALVLDRLPKATVDVHVCILESDGGALRALLARAVRGRGRTCPLASLTDVSRCVSEWQVLWALPSQSRRWRLLTPASTASISCPRAPWLQRVVVVALQQAVAAAAAVEVQERVRVQVSL
jgi:hypothetical protein